MRTTATALVLAVATLAIGGCGGSGSSKTTSSGAGTGAGTSGSSTVSATSASGAGQARFVAGADAICRSLSLKYAAAKDTVNSLAAYRRVAIRRLGEERATLAQLRGLSPPPSLAAQWHQLLSYRESIVSSLTRIVVAAAANDGHSVATAMKGNVRIDNLLIALAQRSGIAECGNVD
ncbi:MAG: hypothetical protein ACRDK4_08020 [Solirubrobacteraceae bacterium]